MTQKRFGSTDTTGRKLDVIGEYLSMYQRALSGTSLETVYIDGFAGSGEIQVNEDKEGLFDRDVRTVIAGSADRAMNVSPPFANYVFIDQRRACIKALEQRFKAHSNAPFATYQVGDANTHIQNLCRQQQWRFKRGVVLLDPFGNQVHWETIQAIAETEALDLWYLFPAGLGVFRQISNKGTVDPTHEPSITRMLGTEDWKTAFLRPSDQSDLFDGNLRQDKIVTPESAAQFMIERLKSVFHGGVMDEMIPLGRHAYASYYLLFAWGNPSEKATKLARKLSKAALRASDRKYGRII